MRETKEKDQSEYHVRSVQRALSILDCFTESNPYLGVTEIGEMLGLHKSTVHALLITLEASGYVAKIEEKNKYALTYKLFLLGNVVSNSTNIKTLAMPIMRRLCDKVNVNVALNVINNRKRLILAVCETDDPIKIILKPGQELSLHSSAAGKILLAGLDDAKIDEIIEMEGLAPMTPKTITDKQLLMAEIADARKNGYALCSGESYWAGSVGAPIFDHTGHTVASLCIFGPMQEFEGKKLVSYIYNCVKSAADISEQMGYNGSTSKYLYESNI